MIFFVGALCCPVISAFVAWLLYKLFRRKWTAIFIGGVCPSLLMQLWSIPLWGYNDDGAAILMLALVAIASFVMLLIDSGVAYLILHDEK